MAGDLSIVSTSSIKTMARDLSMSLPHPLRLWKRFKHVPTSSIKTMARDLSMSLPHPLRLWQEI